MLMLIDDKIVSKAIKYYVSDIYDVPVESIEIEQVDYTELISGDFKGESPFGNEYKYIFIDMYINGVLVRELYREADICFRMMEAFLEKEMGLKKDSYSIEELIPPSEEELKNGILAILNFYSNKE